MFELLLFFLLLLLFSCCSALVFISFCCCLRDFPPYIRFLFLDFLLKFWDYETMLINFVVAILLGFFAFVYSFSS